MRPMRIADLSVSSPDLRADQPFPEPFTAYGEGRMPRIRVTGLPDGTVELALVCHDPDAPMPHGFTHWAVYGIPPEEGVEVGPGSVQRFRVGPTSGGVHGWTGPRPPVGHGVHRYYFWAYALSRPVEGAPTREEFLARHADDIIEQNRLVVPYERSPEA